MESPGVYDPATPIRRHGRKGGSVNARRKLPWLLVLLVTLLLAAVAAGCGGDDDEDGAGEGDTGAAQETTTAEEPIRVGLVTDIGGLNDRGFNSLANQGLERAASELGVETRVLESKSDADYIPNLSQLAEEGYDLIISVGFLMGEATEKAAQEFPDSNFAIIDFAYEAPGPNLRGLVFKEQETGCLVGVVAAMVSESGTVSSVGGPKIPPGDRFIPGYQAFLGDHILTSSLKRVDEAVFQTIEQAVNGEFASGVGVFGLAEDGVGLGETSPEVSQEILDAT